MLTLNPGSVCDVCAEEFGPNRLPHCIPCGHILCLNCCNNIVNKTSSRLTPVCPFCRENFTNDGVRLIRIDFSTSAWNTPKRRAYNIETEMVNDMMSRKRFPIQEQDRARSRAEARRLEDRVANVAAKKCSVEEVSTLHKELEEWLTSDPEDQVPASAASSSTSPQLIRRGQTSLSLSAALLRAILMNHLAHSEASKVWKTAETHLKGKLGDMDIANGKLEAELRRQRSAFQEKATECQTLRSELNRMKMKASAGPAGFGARPLVEDDNPRSRTPGPGPISRSPSTTPRATSPTSPVPAMPPMPFPSSANPLSRFGSHMRSTSASAARSQTPGPPMSARSQTPAPPMSARSQTPGPPLSSRSQTPSLHSPLRSASTAPTRARRVSHSTPTSPQKINRSTSDDKESIHERWIPSIHPDASSPPHTRTMKYAYPSHN